MIQMAVEKITPAIAKEYLEANRNNYRKMSRSVVKRYAEDMKAGRWQLNGEALVFDKNGLLKNGQHRLAAVIVANTPVEMVVVHGIETDVSVYDIGSIRTAEQIAKANSINVN